MKPHARKIGFVILAIVTAFYFYQFVQEDWRPALETWYQRKTLFLLALLLNVSGILMDLAAWILVYRQFGIRPATRLGIGIYFTVYAAQVIPMQLGRLVRSDAIGISGIGKTSSSVQAEVSLFFLDLTALLSLLGALAVYLGLTSIGGTDMRLNAALAIASYGLLAATALTGATLGAKLLGRTRLAYPRRFWRRPGALGALALRTADWVCAGIILYILTRGLPGELGLPRICFAALLSTLVGSGSGLPGGIGATEGVLGWLLGLMELPMAHLVIAVGLYRLITFWAQVPVGWAAVVWVNRCLTATGKPESTPRNTSRTHAQEQNAHDKQS